MFPYIMGLFLGHIDTVSQHYFTVLSTHMYIICWYMWYLWYTP